MVIVMPLQSLSRASRRDREVSQEIKMKWSDGLFPSLKQWFSTPAAHVVTQGALKKSWGSGLTPDILKWLIRASDWAGPGFWKYWKVIRRAAECHLSLACEDYWPSFLLWFTQWFLTLLRWRMTSQAVSRNISVLGSAWLNRITGSYPSKICN